MLGSNQSLAFARRLAVLLLVFLHPAVAFPQNVTSTVAARAGTFYLRILPLGASITWGMGSESAGGNGYRKYLRDALRYDGWNVNMVGSRSGGTMKDSVSLPQSKQSRSTIESSLTCS